MSSYNYDAQGRLVRLDHAQGATKHEAYVWTYDARHRLTSYSSLAEGQTTYGYDSRDQLTRVDRAGTTNDEAYSYDENGNRVSSSSATNSAGSYVTAANNRLTSDGVYSYEYDDEGNRIRRTEIATGAVVEYVWDHRNRLIEVVERNSGGVVQERAEYAYDPGNHRIARMVYAASGSGVETVTVDERYLYDGDQQLAVLDPAGTVTTTYLAVGYTVYAQHRAGHAAEWLLADQLGSTRQVLDSWGTLVASYKYDAYGNLTVIAGEATATTFLYTGLAYDPETGHFYAYHRYYDPTTGRWLSIDWIEDNLNNYYGYVANSPTNFTDPTGLAELPQYGPTDDLVGRRGGSHKVTADVVGQPGAGVVGIFRIAPLTEAERSAQHAAEQAQRAAQEARLAAARRAADDLLALKMYAKHRGLEHLSLEQQACRFWDEHRRYIGILQAWIPSRDDGLWRDNYERDMQFAHREFYRKKNDASEWALFFNPAFDGTGTLNDLAQAFPGGAKSAKAMARRGLEGARKTYQTYTKTNPETGEVYTGRTSGTGTPEQNVARRDANHHMNQKGFGPAQLDKSSTNSSAIRGREQQVMEANGGAKRAGGTSGNEINGISPKNKNRQAHLDQANKEFGS